MLRSKKFALVVFFLGLGVAQAQMIDVREKVSVDVPGGLFSSGPSQQLKDAARKQAVDRAWKRYVAQNFSAARAAQAATNEAALRSLADQACTFNFYDERFDSDAKKFSLEVRGSCDQRRVDVEFARLFQPTAQQSASHGGGSQTPFIGFVWLAKRADNEENFGQEIKATSSTYAEEKESSSTTQSNSRRRSGSSSTDAESNSVSSSERTSTINKDSKYRYLIESTDDVMTSVAQVLQSNNIDIIRYPELVTQCPGPGMKELSQRYAEEVGNTAWDPSKTKGMYDAARQCEVPYFLFGLMEILKSRQSGTNSVEVTVALNASVRTLTRGPLARECAGFIKQYSARGRDRLEATRSAMILTGEQGTRDLLDIMRSNCFR
jgi:hypothetical protein